MLRIALLSGISLYALGAHAQDATWLGGGAPDANEWLQDNNWTPATAPTGTATFDTSAVTTVHNDLGIVVIGGVSFLTTALAYTINVDNSFIVTGAGISNNSANTQVFNILDATVNFVFQNGSTANSGTGAVTYNNNGFLIFQDTSNAGNANTTIINGDILQFFGSSSAASANITNNVELDFFESSTAGNALIGNATGGVITFNNNSTAASATIANALSAQLIFNNSSSAGFAVINDAGGLITFNDSSTLGSAIINSSTGTTVTFNNNSDAGTASVINNGGVGATVTFNDFSSANASIINTFNGGVLTFNNSSSAGTAIINAFNNGGVFLTGTSTGSLAQFVIGTNGVLDISNLTSTGTTAGSIAGAGNFFLGSKLLTVGANNASTTVSGVISDGGTGGGTGGALTKVGTGTLTLSGINTYTGATSVNGGALEVNGSIASSSLTTVNNGGLLFGTGTVGNTSVMAGGIFMPGSGLPGSLMTVTGNLTFASGAIYRIDLDPVTSSMANVSGSAVLGNATVNAIWAPGSYIQRQYTILTAGNVNGIFNAIVNANLPVNFGDSLSYDATHVYLNLAMFVPPAATTTNQRNVANALVNSFNVNGGIPGVFGGLTPAGLDQLSGEVAADFAQVAFQAGNSFLNLMLNPAIEGRFNIMPAGAALGFAADGKAVPPAAAAAFAAVERRPASLDARYGLWGAAFGAGGRIAGDDIVGSHDTNATFYGFAAGLDYLVTPDVLLGFALGGGGTHWSLDQGLGSGRSDMFQAGLYGKTHWGPVYLSAALAYSFHDVTTERTLMIAGTDKLEGRFRANVLSGRLEGGDRFATPWVGITPYGAVQVQSIALPAYAETVVVGSPQFALNYASQTISTTRTELGARFDKSYKVSPDALLTLNSRLAWAHDYDTTRSASAIFQALPASNFIVYGAEPAADSALASVSADYKLVDGWSVTAKFDGEFSRTTALYAGSGIVKKVW